MPVPFQCKNTLQIKTYTSVCGIGFVSFCNKILVRFIRAKMFKDQLELLAMAILIRLDGPGRLTLFLFFFYSYWRTYGLWIKGAHIHIHNLNPQSPPVYFTFNFSIGSKAKYFHIS